MSKNLGKYIVLEGGEGIGKSLHTRLLSEYLRGKGLDVLEVREPGGSEFSERIRTIVKDPKLNKFLEPLTEFLLFSPARNALYATEISPALKQGKIVVSDRCSLSSEIYQGLVGGVSLEFIQQVNNYILNENDIPYNPGCGIIINPNLPQDRDKTLKIVRDLTEKEKSKQHDRFHHKGPEYHLKIYQAYEKVAKQRGYKIVQYKKGQIKKMQREIRKHIDSILEI